MFGRFLAVLVLVMPTLLFGAFQDPKTRPPEQPKLRTVDELKQLPIAMGDSPIAKLLTGWWREGTAAGNVGDWYDNRDGEHSPLDLRPWPQLQKVHYTEEMLKARVNWAAQRKLLPLVVFGNSSTSAPATQGGSNPRQYYTSPFGLKFLSEQYAGNNLYIYPEHRDHDPGHNGVGPKGEEGYGDLYATNTPYLIISQGSSGSDQPFMRAIPYVLAAFRPEVKKKLAENGMLMPTVQMIFRSSNKHLKEGDYLTAKAHPTVFEGSWVDPLKMVTMAHDITEATLPPVVRLKVLEEDQPKVGVDFFDPPGHEKLGDTPAVIARVFRGKERWRRMLVSAEESRDLNGKPLKFEWKVFRGDPKTVKITPKNEAGSVVEIEVAAPVRRPIASGSPMESNRTEIGVFASNGGSWSAPGFITWYGIDHESRTYDDQDRIVELAYTSGEVRFTVQDWWKLLDKKHASWFAPLTEAQSAALAKLDKERAEFHERVKRPDGDPEIETFLFQKYDKAKREFDDKQKKTFREVFGDSHLGRIQQLAKSDLVAMPEYHAAEKNATAEQRAAVKGLAEKIKTLDVPIDAKAPGHSLRKGPTALDREFEELLNAERLGRVVFPDTLRIERIANFVDGRISLARKWRDVYLYDAKNQFVGWVRSQPDRKEPAYFTADGFLITDRDDLGRCKTATNVTYTAGRQPGTTDRLQAAWAPGGTVVEYEYAGPEDRRGKVGRIVIP